MASLDEVLAMSVLQGLLELVPLFLATFDFLTFPDMEDSTVFHYLYHGRTKASTSVGIGVSLVLGLTIINIIVLHFRLEFDNVKDEAETSCLQKLKKMLTSNKIMPQEAKIDYKLGVVRLLAITAFVGALSVFLVVLAPETFFIQDFVLVCYFVTYVIIPCMLILNHEGLSKLAIEKMKKIIPSYLKYAVTLPSPFVDCVVA